MTLKELFLLRAEWWLLDIFDDEWREVDNAITIYVNAKLDEVHKEFDIPIALGNDRSWEEVVDIHSWANLLMAEVCDD